MEKKWLKILEIILIAVAFLGKGYIGFIAWILWSVEIFTVKWFNLKKSGDSDAMETIKKELPIYVGIFIFFIAVKFFAGTL